MKKKVHKEIYFYIFVAFICLSFFMCLLLKGVFKPHNYENRDLSPKPKLSIDNWISYSNEYEAYLNDNIPFRSFFITFNSCIDYYIFNMSSSSKVIKGKSGWLFYKSTLSDYEHSNLYSDDQLETIKNDVITTKEYFEKKGIEFVIFIGPNKNSVYGEYMPDRYNVTGSISRANQVVDYLKKNTNVHIVYPIKELMDVKKKYVDLQLYFKLDTHWNYMGGYWGTLPLLDELGAEKILFETINYIEVNEPDFIWNGYDEANLLGLSNVLKKDVNYSLSNDKINSIRYFGDASNNKEDFAGFVRTYSDAKDKRKIFFARDSFGEAMTPTLAAAFNEMYSIHRDSLTQEHIDEEKPDIFVYEIVERENYLDMFNYKNWNE